MKEENRAMSWKAIADLSHKQRIRMNRTQPLFRIGEIVVVKKTASSIYREKREREIGEDNLVAGFDDCRKPFRGKQGIIVGFSYDIEFGYDYGVLLNPSPTGRGRRRRTISMMEQWLKKHEGGMAPWIAREYCKRYTEDGICQQL